MHSKPLFSDWEAVAESKNCIAINIDEDLSIDGMTLRILGEHRNLLTQIKPDSRHIEICVYTGTPTFVEMITPDGHSVRYVSGSGSDNYKWDFSLN